MKISKSVLIVLATTFLGLLFTYSIDAGETVEATVSGTTFKFERSVKFNDRTWTFFKGPVPSEGGCMAVYKSENTDDLLVIGKDPPEKRVPEYYATLGRDKAGGLVPHGPAMLLYPDGGYFSYAHDQGLMSGKMIRYNAAGKVIKEGNLRNDKRSGVFKYYDANGNLKGTCTYANDIPISATRYATDGNTSKVENLEPFKPNDLSRGK